MVEWGLRSRTGTSPCVPRLSSSPAVFISRGRISTSRQISLPSLPTLFYEYLVKFHSHLANTQAGDGYDSDEHEVRTKYLHDLLEKKKKSGSRCAIVPGSGANHKKKQARGKNSGVSLVSWDRFYHSMGFLFVGIDLC